MKLLITGGAGFIGSNLVCYLLKTWEHVQIVVLDNLSIGSDRDNLVPAWNNKRFDFVYGNICDEALVSALLSGQTNHGKFDGVIHLAAESHVDRSIEAPLGFVKTNVLGTANLLQQSYLNDIERFLYVSTDEVYGSWDRSEFHEYAFSELDNLKPNSPYAASKASGDNLCRAWFKTYELPILVTRCTNNYGPNQYIEKLMPKTISNILNGDKVPVYGNGQQSRDWLHVRDHCRALARVWMLGVPGEIYNIAGYNELTNLELVNRICQTMGVSSEHFIQHVLDRPGHDQRYWIDDRKIRTELGWQSEEDFAAGLQETINFYKVKHAAR